MLTPKTDYSTNLQKKYTAGKATLKVHNASKIAMEMSLSTTSVEPKID
jgi:hypothetical protein